ncbi:MAG: hypothetical protein HY671_01065 [Chloroflexi bacterium]|nr:hypothetical protein [Chloroflexota bacterium]
MKMRPILRTRSGARRVARDYFNEIATFYNIRLAIIPDRLVAVLARLLPETLMGAADFERAPVEVQLTQ